MALHAWLVSPWRSLDLASLCSFSEVLLFPSAWSRYGLTGRNVPPVFDPWYFGIHFQAVSSPDLQAMAMRVSALQHVSFYLLIFGIGHSGLSIY